MSNRVKDQSIPRHISTARLIYQTWQQLMVEAGKGRELKDWEYVDQRLFTTAVSIILNDRKRSDVMSQAAILGYELKPIDQALSKEPEKEGGAE